MPWFYYSGKIVQSVMVKEGVSVAVRPHSRVEILNQNLRPNQVLIKRGLLRRTGRGQVDRPVATLPVVTAEIIKENTPKSALARMIAEKGVTSGRDMAPKKPVGAPEMTEGESNLLKPSGKKEKSDLSGKEFMPDVPEIEDSVDAVEVLSDVDGSPEEIMGEDVGVKRRKRRKK